MDWISAWLLLCPAILLCCTGVSALHEAPCTFNHMCSCKYSTQGAEGETKAALRAAVAVPDRIVEVSCISVPFARIPGIPQGLVTQVDVINSGLEVMSEGDFGDTRISYLGLMSNNIRFIGSRTFSGMSHTLQSLDLSYNELTSVPRQALKPLKSLEWLNIEGNHISGLIAEDWIGLRDTIATLFVGGNDIVYFPNNVFSRCKNLEYLNLDNSNIISLERNSLSRNIQTLILNHNLLSGFPSQALNNVEGLTWLFLRANLMDRLPDSGFRVQKRLDKLDLGENFIRYIPNNLFNGSLTVRDLHLDFNELSAIQDQAFSKLNPGRLYLSSNKILNISDGAFLGGPEHTLLMIDLEKNLLQSVPKALSKLQRLRHLYLPENNISKVHDNAFRSFCQSLESLSLSGNILVSIPRDALENCSTLTHLNLGHNKISDIKDEDFETWGDSLETLVLRNNKIVSIPPHTFRYTPKLRELSLSFNHIQEVNPESFLDVLSTLEILEISFGFDRNDFPEEVLKPLTSLVWVALDNNNFKTISETALYSFGELKYFNMDSNKLRRIPKTLFHQNVHKKLGDIRLALNSLTSLEVHTFHNLVSLRTVVLTGNKIMSIQFEAFKQLPSLSSILLSENQIVSIENKAFSDLPNLIELDLQKNKLQTFSLAAFANITSALTPLSMNLSHNMIENLSVGSGPPPHVKSLDVSHNKMKEVPINFLASFGFSLERLDLSYNPISRLDISAFGPLERLQILVQQHNMIGEIRPRAYQSLIMLQLLDLSHNLLTNVPPECFTDAASLRVLNLSVNKLRSLPNSVFRGTRLETLQLSHNEFVSMPTVVFSEVETTLHYLDISYNHLEHLDSTMFYSFPNLIELNLAHNRLNILPDNVFVSLTNLISLDLSGNPVRANFKELFHYTQKVQKLSLSNIGFKSSPLIPLPNLIYLNLSMNGMTEVEAQSFESLYQLRSLDLSRNNLTKVRARVWKYVPYLKYLDLSYNPIKTFTKDSFRNTSSIKTLLLKNLDNITRFDYDTLAHMKFLKEIYMNSFPNIEMYRFRVGHLLSTVHTLETLHLEVREKELADQLSGAFGPKLKELHLSGKNLEMIDSKTLTNFQNKKELLLSITDTSIKHLPIGLLSELTHVVYLSIDLRRNKLESLHPYVLYKNNSEWESKGTTFVAGGLALEGNDWMCDCSLVWLGKWLRRWLRETLQIHTAMLKSAQQVHTLARAATCRDRYTDQNIPLMDLSWEELGCDASAYAQSIHHAPLTSLATSPLLPAVLLAVLVVFIASYMS